MKQQYEDYKYIMMDTAFLYLGSKYSYQEVCVLQQSYLMLFDMLQLELIKELLKFHLKTKYSQHL